MHETKRCSRCRLVKIVTDFNVDKRSPSGRQCTCNKCRQDARNRNKDGEYSRVKKRRLLNPESVMLERVKYRAKNENLPFNLTRGDIFIPTICPILGIQLVRSEGRLTQNSPSLDRIIPALGYVKGNVWVVSMKANTMKNSATVEELRQFARWVVDAYGA